MLLYRHANGRYLAVAPGLRFADAFGYELCFDGRDVPDVICAAFLRESGGQVLRDDDVIQMSDRSVTTPSCHMRRSRVPAHESLA